MKSQTVQVKLRVFEISLSTIVRRFTVKMPIRIIVQDYDYFSRLAIAEFFQDIL